MATLILKRASASRPSGQWSEDDYDVIADDAVVARIMLAAAAPIGLPWLWTLAYGHHEDRTPTHGYEPTREAAFKNDASTYAASTAALMQRPIGGSTMCYFRLAVLVS